MHTKQLQLERQIQNRKQVASNFKLQIFCALWLVKGRQFLQKVFISRLSDVHFSSLRSCHFIVMIFINLKYLWHVLYHWSDLSNLETHTNAHLISRIHRYLQPAACWSVLLCSVPKFWTCVSCAYSCAIYLCWCFLNKIRVLVECF